VPTIKINPQQKFAFIDVTLETLAPDKLLKLRLERPTDCCRVIHLTRYIRRPGTATSPTTEQIQHQSERLEAAAGHATDIPTTRDVKTSTRQASAGTSATVKH
jgi:hypothetical protein